MAKKSWISRNKRKTRTVQKYAKLRAKLGILLDSTRFPLVSGDPTLFRHSGGELIRFERNSSENSTFELAGES